MSQKVQPTTLHTRAFLNTNTLPSGRTQKGCVVMLDKEKKKIREAMAAEGKELAPFKAKSTPKVTFLHIC